VKWKKDERKRNLSAMRLNALARDVVSIPAVELDVSRF